MSLSVAIKEPVEFYALGGINRMPPLFCSIAKAHYDQGQKRGESLLERRWWQAKTSLFALLAPSLFDSPMPYIANKRSYRESLPRMQAGPRSFGCTLPHKCLSIDQNELFYLTKLFSQGRSLPLFSIFWAARFEGSRGHWSDLAKCTCLSTWSGFIYFKNDGTNHDH